MVTVEKTIDVEMKENNAKLRECFESLLLLSTFLTNEDLFIHIKEVQKEARKNV